MNLSVNSIYDELELHSCFLLVFGVIHELQLEFIPPGFYICIFYLFLVDMYRLVLLCICVPDSPRRLLDCRFLGTMLVEIFFCRPWLNCYFHVNTVVCQSAVNYFQGRLEIVLGLFVDIHKGHTLTYVCWFFIDCKI